MRLVFALIIIVHGLIHVLGFVKAFKISDINQLSQSISKSMGMLWLFVAILFLTSAVVYLFKKDWWFFIAISALVISQLIIILLWKDAKFGTITNVIIMVFGVSALGYYQFERMVVKESIMIFSNIAIDHALVTQKDLYDVPQIIQKWMLISGVVGKEKVVSVRLKQEGTMRTKPQSKWMPFMATQYFNIENPAFVWTTEIDALFGLKMKGRDKLVDGKGAMLIKVASIIPVVNLSNNKQINSGAMIRFLAEICWFPSAALNDYITWETIDSTSAKATLEIGKKRVSGIFKFNSNGDVVSFEADRYFGGAENAQLEKWVITMEDYKDFDGIKIPYKCNVTWKLKEADFEWLNLEVTGLEYNKVQLFSN